MVLERVGLFDGDTASFMPYKREREAWAPRDAGSVSARARPALHSATFLAGLLVVGVLFELPQQSALLKLHVEPLHSSVDGLVRLHNHIYQVLSILQNLHYAIFGGGV